MKKLLNISMLLVLIVTGAVADTQQEIGHLLSYVESTDCSYERNGKLHNGPEARDHINMKYEYHRGRVKTAEDFIRYSATRSKLSGKRYIIHCPGKPEMYANDWLQSELEAFRKISKP